MQKLLFIFCILLLSASSRAQDATVDSLKRVLTAADDDSNKVNTLLQLGRESMSDSPDEATRYSSEARTLAQKLEYKPGEAFALKNIGIVYYNQAKYVETIDYWNQSFLLFDSLGDEGNAALMLSNIGSVYMNQGDDAEALKYFFRSLQLAEQTGDKHKLAVVLVNIGTIYSNNRFTYDKALIYYLRALQLTEDVQDNNVMGGVLVNLGELYLNENKTDSALYYFNRSATAYQNTENLPYSLNDIGRTYTKKGDYAQAKQNHEKAISYANDMNLPLDVVQSYLGLGNMYYQMKSYGQAQDYYEKARQQAVSLSVKKELKDAYFGLSNTYAAQKDFLNAFAFQTKYNNLKDTLFNLDIAQKVNRLESNFEIQKKQGEIDLLTKDRALQAVELRRQKFARNTLAVGLVFVFGISFILFKLYHKVERRTFQLKRSLEELRAAQAQLIQSEKMASLGMLTAGVAHEIQNPLNFVNNFSEVNTELIDEMRQEVEKGNKDEVIAIAQDIEENNQKIAYHGRRADAIVKGMLKHSRSSTGQTEATDLNALADEYLRLSYHGLRAKDKSFNATTNTAFDPAMGKVKVVPQDLGRVLLNLLDNAFYAVTQKAKTAAAGYMPTVWVSTHRKEDTVEIVVRDNGTGVPKALLDKIFQPFFTNKPSGQGTGLGLSLSYDIVKSHGGELKVQTDEGEGTTFSISLPASGA